MKFIINKIRSTGINLAVAAVSIGLPIGALGTLAVRFASDVKLDPGDAAVIVLVPIGLTLLLLRLIAAIAASTETPSQSTESPAPSKIFMAVVLTFSLAFPALIVACLSAYTYQ